jgi:exonuclease SbcD
LGDFTSTLDEAVDYALAQSIDIVVFAGDAYRTRDPNPTYQREFAKRIKRLASGGVPVFLLAGNHDVPAAVGRANSIEIFDILAVDNVQVARTRGIHTFQTKSGPLQIVAVPWLVRNLLLTKEEFKGKTADEINKIMVDSTADFLEKAAARLDPTVPTVVVVHASVLGSMMGSERSVTLGSDYVLPKSLFGNQLFDYVALGHIHKYQVLSQHPLMIYSGSISRGDFCEEKEPKGFVVGEVERG